MSSSQQGRLALALVLLLLATAAGAAQASRQQQDGRYPNADAEGYPRYHYREQPHDFGDYVRIPYEQEQQPHGRMYDKSLLDLDPKASKGYYPPPRKLRAATMLGTTGSTAQGQRRKRCTGDTQSLKTFTKATGTTPRTATLHPLLHPGNAVCDRSSRRPTLQPTCALASAAPPVPTVLCSRCCVVTVCSAKGCSGRLPPTTCETGSARTTS